MNIPIVKEWGSWAVFIFSWLVALITGLSTRPWETGREFSGTMVLTILGLTFLINAKNPLTSTLRTKGRKREHILWFLFFSVVGITLLSPFLIKGIKIFSIFSLLVVSYVVLLSAGKEHTLLTELNGFALLTLSAPIVYYVITGEVSYKLYIAVFVFFAAGVFKVRAKIRKSPFFKWIMVLYCGTAAAIYYVLSIPIILLLPLLENIVSVILMREEKLKTTGNTELIKGVLFVILVIFFWK
jgi:hypothetical protein